MNCFKYSTYASPLTATPYTSPYGRMHFMKKTPFERFDAKINREGECWIWTACTYPNGYGQFDKGYAHRRSYEFHIGPIPDGLVIDHLCRVRNCVNPEHLEPVTQLVNHHRGNAREAVIESNKRRGAQRTHCPHGHEYSSENTRYEVKKNGNVMRRCRTCRSSYHRASASGHPSR